MATQTERALTSRRRRRRLERPGRLGLRRGNLRPQPARLLVEPRLAADRLYPLRRHARSTSSRWSITIPTRQEVETTPYPKAGGANPLVKLGLARRRGRPGRLGRPGQLLRDRLAPGPRRLVPDSQNAYFYVQDRAQTWLDFCTVAAGGKVKRLFRETTKAWVDDPGPPVFLKDGSFLLASARSGWNHLYHYDADGKLKGPVTSGEWELTTGAFQSHPVERVDEKGGWVYFTAKKDSPIASNLYRVKLDGTGLERLTSGPGDHHVAVSPAGGPVHRHLEQPRRADEGAAVQGGRRPGADPGHQPGLRPRGVPRRHLRAGPRPNAGRLRAGREPPQAARLRPEAALPGVGDDLRRAAHADGPRQLGRRPAARRDAGRAGLRRLPHRPAQRHRQGPALDLDRLPPAGRAGAEGPGGGGEVADEERVGRPGPRRPERQQLRRLHDRLRPDAQQAVRRRRRHAPPSPTGATTIRSTPSAT